MKHLEDVYRWAYEVGPAVPNAVEFQMIMSKNKLNFLGPGIEAFATIFADTKEEFHEAMQFMKTSPIKKKALIVTPALNPSINFGGGNAGVFLEFATTGEAARLSADSTLTTGLNSEIARATLGDEVVDHYTNMADVELAAFNAHVTDWELQRSFERM